MIYFIFNIILKKVFIKIKSLNYYFNKINFIIIFYLKNLLK